MAKYFAFDIAINWNIYLPLISKEETIFMDVFQDGDVIRLISFENKKKTKRVLNKYNFIKVDSKNKDDIKIKINNFYERLNDEGKEIFDNKFDINSMTSEKSGNYYYLKSEYKEKSFIIFLYDSKSDVFYLFESVRR